MSFCRQIRVVARTFCAALRDLRILDSIRTGLSIDLFVFFSCVWLVPAMIAHTHRRPEPAYYTVLLAPYLTRASSCFTRGGQDCQRHPFPGVGSEMWPGRAQSSGERARCVAHVRASLMRHQILCVATRAGDDCIALIRLKVILWYGLPAAAEHNLHEFIFPCESNTCTYVSWGVTS